MEKNNADETYTIIYTALKHPIRRKILRMLNEEELTYTEMLNKLDIDTGHLNYYIESLGELLAKNIDGKYRLSEFGSAAIALMGKVEDFNNDKKEIAELKLSKRRLVLLIQAVAIMVLLISSAFFFNVAYNSTYYGQTLASPETVLQPNKTTESTGFVSLWQFHANTPTVQYKPYYRIDIVANATLWIQLLNGFGAVSDGTPLGTIPPGALLLNRTNVIDVEPGSSTKAIYSILVPISPKEPGYNEGFQGSTYLVRIVNPGEALSLNRTMTYNNSAYVKLTTYYPYTEQTNHPYFYGAVLILLTAIIIAVIPYTPVIARKTAKLLKKR